MYLLFFFYSGQILIATKLLLFQLKRWAFGCHRCSGEIDIHPFTDDIKHIEPERDSNLLRLIECYQYH